MLEFRCQKCQRLLQVTTDMAGKQARCPACATVNEVPPAATPSTPSPAAPAEKHSGFDATLPYQHASQPGHGDRAGSQANPYHFLRTGNEDETAAPWSKRKIVPAPIDVGAVLSKSWMLFAANWQGVIAATVVAYLLDSVCGLLVNTLHQSAIRSSDNALAAVLVGVITYVAGTAFTVWITAGLLMYLLRVARGERVHFGQLFEAGPVLIAAMIATVVYSTIVAIGLVACIVPGVILGLMFWMAIPLTIDARLGVGDAFRVSQQVTNGNKGALVQIWIVSAVVTLLGMVPLCLGLIVAAPYVALLNAVAYLEMTGQSVAGVKAATPAARPA